MANQQHGVHRHTFKELLARILLEEGFMLDRFVKIVDHQLEDRLDLIFGVSRIVSKGCILNQSTRSRWYQKGSFNDIPNRLA